jgi:hypothetical protein
VGGCDDKRAVQLALGYPRSRRRRESREDPEAQFIDDIEPLQTMGLYRVRGAERDATILEANLEGVQQGGSITLTVHEVRTGDERPNRVDTGVANRPRVREFVRSGGRSLRPRLVVRAPRQLLR